MTRSIVLLAATLLSLASIGCSTQLAPQGTVTPAAATETVSALREQDACRAGHFAACSHLANALVAKGDAKGAFDVMAERCTHDPSDKSPFVANACFAAAILASNELHDDARAVEMQRYRCDAFGPAYPGNSSCADILPSKTDTVVAGK